MSSGSSNTGSWMFGSNKNTADNALYSLIPCDFVLSGYSIDLTWMRPLDGKFQTALEMFPHWSQTFLALAMASERLQSSRVNKLNPFPTDLFRISWIRFSGAYFSLPEHLICPQIMPEVTSKILLRLDFVRLSEKSDSSCQECQKSQKIDQS